MEKYGSEEYLQKTNCCVDKNKIKKLRKDQALKLDDIAKLTGIPRGTVWKIESYKYGMQLCDFIAIAEALGFPFNHPLLNGYNENATIED